MQYTRYALWLLACCFLAGCVNPPEYPDEPVIAYESVNKNTIYQYTNGPEDSITINFSFTDGDGDLSGITDSVDIFLEDSRLPGQPIPFSLPIVPIEGTGNGISGEISLRIVNTGQFLCCIAQPNPNRPPTICAEEQSVPIDTFSYSIQLQDRAGNLSNKIQTEQLQILCLNQ